MKNSKIAFCDSLNTLKEQGYPIENFTKTPLIFGRFIEFDAETPEGLIRCMLDTGSTLNMLNIEHKDGKSLEELAWDPCNLFECSFFNIGDKNIGPIPFHRMPIGTPSPIEAIMGMEFIKDYLIFIDFGVCCTTL